MKVAIVGASGFIGSHVAQEVGRHHEVVPLSRSSEDPDFRIDLSDVESVKQAMLKHRPDAVINCSGIINPAEAHKNVEYTTNLFDGIQSSGVVPERVITTGSASVYGTVDSLPVAETAESRPANDYALSKAEEEKVAREKGKNIGTKAVVARVFNPIGPAMPGRMLIPNLLNQAREIKEGNRHEFELSRLDVERDFIDVRDLARAYAALLVAKLDEQDPTYNIGTGKPTANSELLRVIKQLYDISQAPVNETMPNPEVGVASQADIRKLQRDTGWKPEYTLDETMEYITHAERN